MQLALLPVKAVHAARACVSSWVPFGAQSSKVCPTPSECTVQGAAPQLQPAADPSGFCTGAPPSRWGGAASTTGAGTRVAGPVSVSLGAAASPTPTIVEPEDVGPEALASGRASSRSGP